jgi:hypothetical protein
MRTPFVSTLVITNASGIVDASFTQHDSATNQLLRISVARLNVSTNYLLRAMLIGDTNLLDVASFDTDKHGRANIRFRRKSDGTAGHAAMLLPDVLNPVTEIAELEISNGDTQAVLIANLRSPITFKERVRRSLNNDGVESGAMGLLRVRGDFRELTFKVHHKLVQEILDISSVRVLGSGLMPNSTYFLALNGTIVANKTSNARGNVSFHPRLRSVPGILDTANVSILNSTSNSVLSVAVP